MKRITDLPIGMKVEIQSGHDKRLSGVIAKAPAWAAMRQGEMIPVETEEGVKLYAPQTIFVEYGKTYPHDDGDVTVIGPECFAAKDGSVLNWQGVNYVPQDPDPS